jgi:hydrogenase expression/formation protein HypE
MSEQILPLGKLPASLLAKLLETNPIRDPSVILGPGIGMDCAVVDLGEKLLVLKSDPITFTTGEIGQYLVHVNANDIATTGGRPRWLLVTLLLPEGLTTEGSVAAIYGQITEAAESLGITIIGGHTEITYGIDRVLAIGTLIGEVDLANLVTPQGVQPGDRILVTKGIAIEATAIGARDFSERLRPHLTEGEINTAEQYLSDPGISVLPDARVAMSAGKVSAMHDPTEGGLASALWELATACGHSLIIELASIPISDLSRKLCRTLDIDPLASISSGALLLTCPATDAKHIRLSLIDSGISCAEIGEVEDGPPKVRIKQEDGHAELPWPERDEITRLY